MHNEMLGNKSWETGTVSTLETEILPPPEELATDAEPEMVKVTLTLHKDTVDFFKGQATRLDASYQRMIRNLLSEYVRRQAKT